MTDRILDDFTDVTSWTAVASGLAQLVITRERGPHGWAMRLDFDFKGGGGFVVARKKVSLPLTPSYVLTFDVRAQGPANKFELKLADASERNVWWYHDADFDFSSAWRRMRIPNRQIEFAWGPAGGGAMSEVGAIELAVAAGLGGSGSLWISDLRFHDTSQHPQPHVQASSAVAKHPPQAVVNGSPKTMWRSRKSDERPWILLDLHEERELGGLVVQWDRAAPSKMLEVQTSTDGTVWTTRSSADGLHGFHSYVYLPECTARFLKLTVEPRTAGRAVGVAEVSIQPYEFSRSIDAFFRCVAQGQRRGRYPKYLYAEQTYWSPVGTGDGLGCAILNEEGMVEVDHGSFSLEPFLAVDGRLLTWADAAITQELERGYLPIPSSSWRAGSVGLRVTAFAGREHETQVLYVRYRVRNYGAAPMRARLFVAIRPFQVTPPWQSFKGLGGTKQVHEISYDGHAVRVDRAKTITPLTAPSGFGAATTAQGAVTEYLDEGVLPLGANINDAFGYASAALGFDLDLAAASDEDVYVAVPFGASDASKPGLVLGENAGAVAFERACRTWETRLGQVDVMLPEAASACVETLRTAAAHILIHRDGPALHPGPRRYARAWIRDGAIMAAALLRMGCAQEACDFVRWYCGYQAPAGDVPCAVDRDGPDWLTEHDSHGELIFAIAECFRHTRDRALLLELWPHALGAARAIERLRATRLTPEFEEPAKLACHGLLPESVSHEGYLAHPVHSYYDDFWALRGLGDAAALARAVGDDAEAAKLATLRDELGKSLYRSIALTIEERNLDYIPGSVEWADFDPTATTTAMMLLDIERGLPPGVLGRTYDEYLAGLRKRRDGKIDWDKYTAYEIRTVCAMLRLGRRADAHELLDFFLGDRRPRAWNQWPEISWRDPRSPGHLGDVPHTWIAAEYVLAFLGMFASQRVEDDGLLLAAGISDEWLADGGEVGIRNLPTYYGRLSYTLRREAPDVLRLSITGTPHTMPALIVVLPPLSGPLRRVEVDGRAVTTFDAKSVTISQWPAEVLMTSGSG